jgi:hypothetical protein
LLTVEGQHLSQAAKLARRAETTMDQHVDRLARIEAQAPIRIVRARAQAGNVDGDGGWRLAAGFEIERSYRLAGRAATKKTNGGHENDDANHVGHLTDTAVMNDRSTPWQGSIRQRILRLAKWNNKERQEIGGSIALAGDLTQGRKSNLIFADINNNVISLTL